MPFPGTSVSRETSAKLEEFSRLLVQWNTRINLVARSTIDDLQTRHIRDSLQLAPLLDPEQKIIADLGSGAGLPGMILAIATGHDVHLIEADKRKAAFLRQVKANLGLPNVTIHPTRVEEVRLKPDIITSRAFAPLNRLLQIASKMLASETRLILLKGTEVQSELTEAERHWHMETSLFPSEVCPTGSILQLRRVVAKHD